MRQPLSRLDLHLVRPFFLFDEGAVRTTASEWEGRLVFVHELRAGDETRAVVVEQFATGREAA